MHMHNLLFKFPKHIAIVLLLIKFLASGWKMGESINLDDYQQYLQIVPIQHPIYDLC